MSLYGKHFGSMYEGSLVGNGAMVFALMGYVIAKMTVTWTGRGRAKVVTEGTISLNAKVLSAVFGEPKEKIQRAIEFLCAPDTESTSKGEEGRRLIRIGEFEYRVVNAPHYQNLKDQEDKREKNRVRQSEYRQKKRGGTPGEGYYLKAVEAGQEPDGGQMAEDRLKERQAMSEKKKGQKADEQ